MDDVEDWEEWDPTKGSFLIHTIAGSTAGVMEHVVCYPIDTIKTHLQTTTNQQRERGKGSGGVFKSIRRIVRKQGVARLWRGTSTMFIGCIPAHATYFSVYEICKEKFGANGVGHNPIAAGTAGMVATVGHDAIMTPMDVMKQRLQLGYYEGLRDCFRRVLATEGLAAFFVSLPTTLAMNVPYGAVMVASHESFKKILNPSGERNLPAFLLSGSAAGALAAVVTNPLDVVKTKLQTQGLRPIDMESSASAASVTDKNPRPIGGHGGGGGSGNVRNRKTPYRPWRKLGSEGGNGRFNHSHGSATNLVLARHKMMSAKSSPDGGRSASGGLFRRSSSARPSSGLRSTVRQIIAEDGYRGFLRGIKPRVMTHAPAMGISWGTYETVKRILGGE